MENRRTLQTLTFFSILPQCKDTVKFFHYRKHLTHGQDLSHMFLRIILVEIIHRLYSVLDFKKHCFKFYCLQLLNG